MEAVIGQDSRQRSIIRSMTVRRLPGARILRACIACGLAIALRAPAMAQEIGTESLRTAFADGRPVIVMPSAPVAAAASPGRLNVQSYESGSHRVHVVTVDGESYRAATPLAGSRSLIAFDPARRRFVALLPSIRVELDGGGLDAVAEAVRATGVDVFESAGFAVVELPTELHPADALAIVEGLPGAPDASLRPRGARIRWR